ncbi:hypothetical protein PR048_000289 [Dryococelus australis]|uniref:Uncharacterized protein n=1 Tax=Dryococelus australis TaxID=614101 RepID=A0ABQ9IF46_9NEOP|nr:hypothetical protein PR048_000289 [Dryococelus australis]
MKGRGKREIPRENPPTNGIVRHDSHLRKSVRIGSAWRAIIPRSRHMNRAETVNLPSLRITPPCELVRPRANGGGVIRILTLAASITRTFGRPARQTPRNPPVEFRISPARPQRLSREQLWQGFSRLKRTRVTVRKACQSRRGLGGNPGVRHWVTVPAVASFSVLVTEDSCSNQLKSLHPKHLRPDKLWAYLRWPNSLHTFVVREAGTSLAQSTREIASQKQRMTQDTTAVVNWSDYSIPTKANRLRIPAHPRSIASYSSKQKESSATELINALRRRNVVLVPFMLAHPLFDWLRDALGTDGIFRLDCRLAGKHHYNGRQWQWHKINALTLRRRCRMGEADRDKESNDEVNQATFLNHLSRKQNSLSIKDYKITLRPLWLRIVRRRMCRVYIASRAPYRERFIMQMWASKSVLRMTAGLERTFHFALLPPLHNGHSSSPPPSRLKTSLPPLSGAVKRGKHSRSQRNKAPPEIRPRTASGEGTERVNVQKRRSPAARSMLERPGWSRKLSKHRKVLTNTEAKRSLEPLNPPTHAREMASVASKNVGTPPSDQGLLTYAPTDRTANREPFAVRSSIQSDTKPVSRASCRRSQNEYDAIKGTASLFLDFTRRVSSPLVRSHHRHLVRRRLAVFRRSSSSSPMSLVALDFARLPHSAKDFYQSTAGSWTAAIFIGSPQNILALPLNSSVSPAEARRRVCDASQFATVNHNPGCRASDGAASGSAWGWGGSRLVTQHGAGPRMEIAYS